MRSKASIEAIRDAGNLFKIFEPKKRSLKLLEKGKSLMFPSKRKHGYGPERVYAEDEETYYDQFK